MTKETKAQLIAARAHERARLLLLLEEFESTAKSYRDMEAESAAALRGHTDRYEHEMHTQNELRRGCIAEAYEKCARSLRAALRLDSQPTAATPKVEP